MSDNLEVKTGETNAIIGNFNTYSAERVERLNQLAAILSEGLPIVEGFDQPDGANDRLIKADRTDLIMTQPVLVQPIDDPSQITSENCNNFFPQFKMPVGVREIAPSTPYGTPEQEPIPPTVEDILALRAVPNLKSHAEVTALEESKKFKALHRFHSHSSLPAFLRMLNLFPDFTADLVTRVSAPDMKGEGRYDHFQADFFVAYQFMSRLVDDSDRNIKPENDEGTANLGYLY